MPIQRFAFRFGFARHTSGPPPFSVMNVEVAFFCNIF
jgi:hypothetical protein